MPKTVVGRLIQLQKRFFWGRIEGDNGGNLITWEPFRNHAIREAWVLVKSLLGMRPYYSICAFCVGLWLPFGVGLFSCYSICAFCVGLCCLFVCFLGTVVWVEPLRVLGGVFCFIGRILEFVTLGSVGSLWGLVLLCLFPSFV